MTAEGGDALAAHPEPATELDEEERGFVETALRAADAGNAGHWPTVAAYLAAEVRRLRALNAPVRGIAEGGGTADVVDALFWEHRAVASNGTQTVCACDRAWRSDTDHRTHLRDRLLALLKGANDGV